MFVKSRKNFISVLVTLTMIISTCPVFADDEDSFASVPAEQDQKAYESYEMKAASANPVGSSSDPFYVKPQSSTGTRYYLTNTGAVSQSSTTIGTFVNMVTELTYSLAYDSVAICNRINALGTNYLSDIETNTDTLIGKLGNVESDVDDIRRYLNVDYYQLMTNISNKVTAIAAKGAELGPLVPYLMPDPTIFDYTSDTWKKYIVRTANSTSASTVTKVNDSFIVQFKDYLNAQNLMEYWTYKREFDFVVPDDYASETYNKWINVNNGNEYTAFKRSVWVDIRYINRFLSNLIYKTTGILPDTTFTLYDCNNTANNVTPNSLYDFIRISNEKITESLGRLAYVLANDKDIALRESQEGNVQAMSDNLTSGNVSVSSGKIGAVKNIGNDIVSGLSSNANVSDGVSVLSGNSEAWSWFSTATAEAFDSSVNARKGSSYRYLDEYNRVIGNYVGKPAVPDN